MPSDPSPRLPTPETIERHLEAPSNRGLSIAEWDVLQAYAAGRLVPRETDAEHLVLEWPEGAEECYPTWGAGPHAWGGETVSRPTAPHPPAEPQTESFCGYCGHGLLPDSVEYDHAPDCPAGVDDPEVEQELAELKRLYTPYPQEPDAHLLELMDGIDSLAVEDDPAKQRTILRYIVQRLQRDGRRIRTLESKLVGGSGTTHYDRLDKLESDVAELRKGAGRG